jgi:predicted DNA-binding transcriptional regulator YafY
MTIPTTRKRRPVTAKVAAARLGISERTVQRYVAEERETYESRAAARRAIAGRMRSEGATWEEIAAAVDGSVWSARALVRRHQQEQEQEQKRLKAGGGGEGETPQRPSRGPR